MKLVGINGFKTSGKDTTFQIVQDYAGTDSGVARAGFADKLKIMAAKALGFQGDDEDLIATMDDFKETGIISHSHSWLSNMGEFVGRDEITGRQYLQYFGGNAREVFGDTFWIDQVLPTPIEHPSRGNRHASNAFALGKRYPGVDLLCITDVRYENEAERVKQLDGVVWEVVRPGVESDGHSSEKPLPRHLVDYTILNDSDLATLRTRVVEAIGATL